MTNLFNFDHSKVIQIAKIALGGFGGDIGNGDGKPWLEIEGNRVFDFHFKHRLAVLDVNDIDRYMEAGRLKHGYTLITHDNKQHLYAYGDVATYHDSCLTVKIGAERYVEGYFDALYFCALSYALNEFVYHHNKSYRRLRLQFVATHAPRDFDFRPRIKDLIEKNGQEITIEGWHGVTKVRSYAEVQCRPEPIGAFYSYALRKDGNEDRRLDLSKQIIVFDGGSTTFDTTVVKNGEIMEGGTRSYAIGIGLIYHELYEYIKRENLDLFQHNNEMDVSLVLNALLTGRYAYGISRKLDCADKADELRSRLLNAISTVFDQQGGVRNQLVVFGGGASMATYPLFKEKYGRDVHVRKATAALERIRYAIINGVMQVVESPRSKGI